MEDQKLIEKILQGQTSAFATLIDRYKDRVYALALRMNGSREDAEEILQDVFLKVYENLAEFKGTAKFSTWIYRIAYNMAVSKLRKTTARKDEIGVADYAIVETQDLVGVLEPLKREEQKQFLSKALEQLKPQERTLVELFYLDELHVEEIVAITGESATNVKVKLHRTRQKLHKLLTAALGNEVQEFY